MPANSRWDLIRGLKGSDRISSDFKEGANAFLLRSFLLRCIIGRMSALIYRHLTVNSCLQAPDLADWRFLSTGAWYQFLLRRGTFHCATAGQMLTRQWWLILSLVCIVCYTRVSRAHRRRNKALGIMVFVTLFFERGSRVANPKPGCYWDSSLFYSVSSDE